MPAILPLPRHVVNDAVARAIAEDQGGRGDVTSLACIPAKAEAKFYVNAREAGVVCGFQPALAAVRATPFPPVPPPITIRSKFLSLLMVLPFQSVAAVRLVTFFS